MNRHFGLFPLPLRERYDTPGAVGSGLRGRLANSFNWNCPPRLPLTPNLSRNGRGGYSRAQLAAKL